MKFNSNFIFILAFICASFSSNDSYSRVGRMGGWASDDNKLKVRENDNETFDEHISWAEDEKIVKPAYQPPAYDEDGRTGDMDIDYTGSNTYKLPPVLESVKDLEIK
ncbi:MAG: hypothetical protein N4A44_01670 [Alphaproteobacteria bacterium]|nr:hypothetical protein [Alphaproteobacteria bacterium]